MKTEVSEFMRFRLNAGGGTRTHTPLLTTDFESVSSANSDTPANIKNVRLILYNIHDGLSIKKLAF